MNLTVFLGLNSKIHDKKINENLFNILLRCQVVAKFLECFI